MYLDIKKISLYAEVSIYKTKKKHDSKMWFSHIPPPPSYILKLKQCNSTCSFIKKKHVGFIDKLYFAPHEQSFRATSWAVLC